MELKAYITMSDPTLCVCVSVLLIVEELMYKLGAVAHTFNPRLWMQRQTDH